MKSSKPGRLEQIISTRRNIFSNIFPFDLRPEKTFHLDLSDNNSDLLGIDICDNNVFDEYLAGRILLEGQKVPVGGYNERRVLYSGSNHFGSGADLRNIHLGIDIWVESGTPIAAPLESKVHSFSNNTNYRDYGPTIILEHFIEELTFYSLYGHLSLESLDGIFPGKRVEKGEIFASIGDPEVNGSWPPHLHFQLICDMGDYKGDFPGVCSGEQRQLYLELCPNPDIIFGLNLPWK